MNARNEISTYDLVGNKSQMPKIEKKKFDHFLKKLHLFWLSLFSIQKWCCQKLSRERRHVERNGQRIWAPRTSLTKKFFDHPPIRHDFQQPIRRNLHLLYKCATFRLQLIPSPHRITTHRAAPSLTIAFLHPWRQ